MIWIRAPALFSKHNRSAGAGVGKEVTESVYDFGSHRIYSLCFWVKKVIEGLQCVIEALTYFPQCRNCPFGKLKIRFWPKDCFLAYRLTLHLAVQLHNKLIMNTWKSVNSLKYFCKAIEQFKFHVGNFSK